MNRSTSVRVTFNGCGCLFVAGLAILAIAGTAMIFAFAIFPW